MSFFQIIWFVLIGVLLLGYSILDGFDLGIGSLLPFLAKNEKEKRVLLNSIGPVWDGNEVWLLTGGGALFAAFPHAYATVFSGFYLALMLVLFALIFRAVSFEFRAHDEESRKGFWEWSFILGSFLPALLTGVALGNVVYGVPLDRNMEYAGTFFTLLRPFPLLVGVGGLLMFLMMGLGYTLVKTNGDIKKRALKILNVVWIAFIVVFAITVAAGVMLMPHTRGKVLAWVFTAVAVVLWIMIKMFVKKEKYVASFVSTALLFASLWAIIGAIHFPNLVRATGGDELNITITNASSSPLTLKIMFIIALIGVPLILVYHYIVYRAFRGKVVIED